MCTGTGTGCAIKNNTEWYLIRGSIDYERVVAHKLAAL